MIRICYIDISVDSFVLNPVFFQKPDCFKRKMEETTRFYFLPSTQDYILKMNSDLHKNDDNLLKFVSLLIEAQRNVTTTEFPIGYCLNNDKVVGQVIRN